MKLIIFDLDQTLVDLISVHDRATEELFQKHFGADARLTQIDFAGKSIINNLIELAELKGVDAASIKKHSLKILEEYEQIFGKLIPEDASGYILPGAKNLLESLSQTDNFLTLYTGDSLGIVNHVFRTTGLGRYFHFAVYAEEARNRLEMVKLVIARAEKITGRTFRDNSIVIIGDSIRDIEAGKAFNALTIAIATGFHSKDMLAAHKPDYLFDSLENYRQVIEAIGYL